MIDTHVHLDLPNEDYYTTRKFELEDLLECMNKFKVEKSVVFINPALKKYVCENFLDKKHRTKLVNCENNCKLVCAECGKVLYSGKDCYHDNNIKLLEIVKPYKFLKPLVFLACCPDTIDEEVEFFEKNYANEIYGYKIYPKLFLTTMKDININSTKTVLVHDVRNDLEYSQSIIDFAKRYKGNVVIAHVGHFKQIVLDAVNELPNLYIDTSPFCEIARRYHPQENKENLLKSLLLEVNNDKILFATDTPSGNFEEEINFMLNLGLDEQTFTKITKSNAEKVFNIGENNGK